MKQLIIAATITFCLCSSLANAQEDELPLIKQIEQLVIEKNYMQEQLEAVQSERDILKNTVASYKDKLDNPNDTGSAHYEDLLLQKNSLIRQITNIRQEKVILQQKIKNLEDKVKLQSVNKALETDSNNTILKNELTDISQKYKRAIRTVDQISETNTTLRAKIAELEARLVSKNEAFDSEENSKRASLNNMITTQRKKIKALTEQLDQAKLTREIFENDLAVADNKIQSYVENNTQQKDLLGTKLRAQSQQYENNIKKLKKSHQEKMKQLEDKLATVMTEKNNVLIKSQTANKAREQLKIARFTNNNLRQEISELKGKVKSQQRTINVTMKEEAEQFTQTISELQNIIEDNKMKNIEAIQNAKAPLIEKISSLTRSRDALEEDAVALKRQLSEVKQTFSQKTETIKSSMNSVLEEKTQTITNLQSQLQKIKDHNTKLLNDKSKNETQIITLKNKISSAEKNITQLQDIKTEHVKNIQGLTEELSQIKDARDQLESKLQNNLQTLQTFKGENKDLKYAKSNNEQQLARNDEKIDTLNKTIGKLESKIEGLYDEKNELIDSTKEISSRLDASTNTIQSLNKNIEELTKTKENLNQQINTARATVNEKEQLTTDLENTMRQKETLINTLKAEIAQLTEKNENKVSEVDNLLREKEKLNKTITSLNQKMTKLGQDIDQKIEKAKSPLLAKVEALNKQVAVKDQLVAERDGTIDWLDGKNKKINDLFSRSEQENASLRKENARYIEELKQVKTEHSEKITQIHSDYDKQIQSLNDRITNLLATHEDKLAEQKKLHSQQISDLETLVRQKNTLLEENNQKYEELMAIKQAQASQLNEQKLANTKLKNTKYDLELKINTLEEKSAENIHKLTQTEQELENLNAKVSAQKDVINELTQKKNNQLNELESLSTEKLNLHQNIEKLESLLRNANDKLAIETNKTKQNLDEMQELSKKLESANRINNDITVRNEALQSGLEELRHQYKKLEADHKVALNNTRTPLEHKIKSLEDEIIGLTHNNQDYVDTIENLKQEMLNYRSELLNVKQEKSELQQEYILAAKKLEKIETKVPDEIAEAKMPLEASIKFLERRLLQVEQQKEELERKIKTLELGAN